MIKACDSGTKPLAILSRTAILAALLLAPGPALADLSDALKAIERRDFPAAARELSPLAQAGDAEAQYQLGTLYANGDGVPQNYEAARGLFSAAASQGNGRARQALDFLVDIGALSAAARPGGAAGGPVQPASMPAVARGVTTEASATPISTNAAAPSGPAAPPGFRLQLGTVLSEAGGSAEARRVARRFQAQLAGVAIGAEPYQMASGDIVYRVLTPVLAEAQAREICDRIRAEYGPCLLINP